jgi:ADP-heptose:LPS heptosyltransferase
MRVLVLRAGLLGDTLFATSIFEPLRETYGRACEIHLVLRKGLAALFRGDPRISRILEIQYRKIPVPLHGRKLRLVGQSWLRPYDLVVNLETGPLFNDLMYTLRAHRKIGRPWESALDDRPGEHAIERLRRIYELFLPSETVRRGAPSLIVPEGRRVVQEFGLPERYFVLNPTNSHFQKNDYRSYRAWPEDHWHRLIHLLTTRRTEALVLIGGAGEEGYLSRFLGNDARIISLAGRTHLDQLVAVIAGARAMISTDTGPSHVAAAVNTPVLVIFGPSDYHRTAPFSTPENHVRVLTADLECSPCSLTGAIRDCPWNRCMHEVTPERVLEEMESMGV